MTRRLVSRYWWLLPLLIGVVVLIDRVEQPTDVVTEDTINMKDTRSDYYLSDFSTRKFNNKGSVEFIVEGDTLAHYPDDDRSEITDPRVEIRREGIVWLAESAKGRYDPATDLFTLSGDVTVKRVLQNIDKLSNEITDATDNSLTQITMSSPSLRIASDANLVETDDFVQITAPTWNLKAKGLRTAIDHGQLSLLQNVVARFEPTFNNEAD